LIAQQSTQFAVFLSRPTHCLNGLHIMTAKMRLQPARQAFIE
jgi:hypothetical protein